MGFRCRHSQPVPGSPVPAGTLGLWAATAPGMPVVPGQHGNNANNYWWGGRKPPQQVCTWLFWLVPNTGRHRFHFRGSVHRRRRRRLVGPDQHTLLGSVQELGHLAIGQCREGIRSIDVVHVCLRSVEKQGEMIQLHL